MKSILSCLYPSRCVLCHEYIAASMVICSYCEAQLPWEPVFNPDALVLFRYKKPVNRWIIELKFYEKILYAKVFAHFFITHLEKYRRHDLPLCLVPIPLHHRRLSRRGFNQALEIARPIAHHFHMHLDALSCIRTQPTLPQTLLSKERRQNNVKHAFSLKRPITFKKIAILDDVITTGSTIKEVQALFTQQGIAVEIWCCARSSLSATG